MDSGPIAVISDVHSNLPALEAVLSEIDRRGGARIVCLGDIVGYGPEPSACLAMVRARAEAVVQGNHDEAAGGDGALDSFAAEAGQALAWTRRRLGEAEKIYLRSLPLTAQVSGFSLVHANFFAPQSWGYILKEPDAGLSLKFLPARIGFFGHTHRPLVYARKGKRIVREPLSERPFSFSAGRLLANPGSVGQPRDRDPRAAFLLVDPAAETIRLVRVEYDHRRTCRDIRAAGLPGILGERLALGI